MKRLLYLLIVTALAGNAFSIQASEYSENIVGYANIVTPGGKNSLLSCPFTIGASNGVNEVFGSSLPAFSELLFWTGSGFTIALYDTTDPSGIGSGAPVWYQGDDVTPLTSLPTIPPGLGFFLVPGTTTTNVFAGTVAVNVGTSNTMPLLAGKNNLVGCVIPYAGTVTSGNNSTGGPNLNNHPNFSELLFWTGSGYKIALYDPTDPAGLGTDAPVWYNGDDATPYVDVATSENVPTITVGQGFFVVPGSAYNWITGI